MANSVELDTIQATKQVQNLRQQVELLTKSAMHMQNALAKVSAASKTFTTQIRQLAEANTKLQARTKKLSADMTAANKRIRSLEATVKRLSVAKRAAAAASSRLSAQMVRQKVAVANANEQLRNMRQRFTLLGGSKEGILALETAFQKFRRTLQAGELNKNQMAEATIRWRKSMGEATRELRRLGSASDKSKKDLTDLGVRMQNLGSAAVFAFGPLSGVGARLIAFGAITQRVGVGIAAISAGIAAIAVGFVGLARVTIQAGLALDKIEGTFRAATGSMGAAREEFIFVRKVAHELGLSLEPAALQFAKLTAAARGTVLEGKPAREIFEGLSIAATALRLSTEQTEGAFRAVEQMISKGTVQAEELRGQLGERLPGAFQLAARAMGVTTMELGKMLEGGEVLAEDLLPKLADELKRAFGPEAAVAAGKLAAEIKRLETNWFELTVQLEEWLETSDIAAKILRNLNANLERFTTKDFIDEFMDAKEAVGDAKDNIQDALDELARRRALNLGDESISTAAKELEFAFRDAMSAEEAFFTIYEKHKREIEAEGITVTIKRQFTPNIDTAPLPTNIPGNMPRPPMQGPALDFLEKFAVPDELTELRQELGLLGSSDLQKDLRELDLRLDEITESIREMPKPDKLTALEFRDFKKERVEEAIDGINRLKQALIDLRDERIGDLFAEQTNAQEVLRLQIAGNMEAARAKEAELEAVQMLGEDATPELIAKLKEELILTEKLTEQLKEQTEQVKEQEKLRERIAGLFASETAARDVAKMRAGGDVEGARFAELKTQFEGQLKGSPEASKLAEDLARIRIETEKFNDAWKESEKIKNAIESQTEALNRQIDDMKVANRVLELRIKGEDALADAIEARYEVMTKFPNLSAEETKALEELIAKNKELQREWEELKERQKEARKLAQDFASVIGESFENAILNGEKLSDVFNALLKDIQRIILRVLVTKPLENFLTGVFTGEDTTGSKAGPGGTPFFGGILGTGKNPFSGFFEDLKPGATPPINPSDKTAEELENLGVASRRTSEAMEGAAGSTTSVGSSMSGAMLSAILQTAASKTTETATTQTLTGALIALQNAANQAAGALTNLAASAGGGGSAAGGGSEGGGFFGMAGSLIGSFFGGGAGGSPGPNVVTTSSGATYTSTVGRQHGGFMEKNRPHRVHRDELIVPLAASRAIPAEESGGGVTVNQNYTIVAPDPNAFRRSARSNLRVGAMAARSVVRN